MGTEDKSAKGRSTRTRTGCKKCRVRRRKCDEGKPSCQRCVNSGFECQYGQRLSFLKKNALTLGSVSNLEDHGQALPRVQFVAPRTPSRANTFVDEGERGIADSPGTSRATVRDPSEPANSATSLLRERDHQPEKNITATAREPERHDELSHWPPAVCSQDEHASPTQSVVLSNVSLPITETLPQDAAFETALTVLLSLGNDAPTPASAKSAAPAQDLTSTSTARLRPPTSTNTVAGPSSMANLSLSCEVSNDRLLQLMRFYRYQIAPWLDICDMSQTFGLVVPRLATESQGLMHSLLTLSALSQRLDEGPENVADADYLHAVAEANLIQHPGLNAFSDVDVAHVAFASTARFLTGIPRAWHGPCSVFGEDFLGKALGHATSQVRVSLFSLLLRLELSAALINGTVVSVPEKLSYNPLSQRWSACSLADRISHYTLEPLLLCAKAHNLCTGRFQAPQVLGVGGVGVPETPVQRWTMLNDALNAWYANRPDEFQTMAEIDSDEALFPVVMLTNGAAVLANQLYHTAMLLLLQNKPRTLQAVAGQKMSKESSPLWHARRICGIALNNDRRDMWDLSLVASLYVAAQRMTYEPQQHAILGYFDRLRAITGWEADAFATRLRQDWGVNAGAAG